MGNAERKVGEEDTVFVMASPAVEGSGSGRWLAAGIPVCQCARSSCARRHGRLSNCSMGNYVLLQLECMLSHVVREWSVGFMGRP